MVYNLPKDTLSHRFFRVDIFCISVILKTILPITAEPFFILGYAQHFFQSKNTVICTVKTVYHFPKVRTPTQSFFRVDVLLNVCNFENRLHITADTYFILGVYARHYFKAQKYGYRQDGKPFT